MATFQRGSHRGRHIAEDGFIRNLGTALHQECKRTRHAAVGDEVGRLEEAGFIARYETRLAPARLDLNVVAFILVAMEKGHIRDLSKFTDLVLDMPEVLECYSITGDYDFVIKVIARDLKGLSHFLIDKLMRMPGVDGVRSSVCLEEFKCTNSLPLPE